MDTLWIMWAWAGSAFLLILYFLTTRIEAGDYVSFRVVVLLSTLVLALIAFRKTVIQGSASERLRSGATLVLSFFVLGLLLETGFLFLARTHLDSRTLAHQRWEALYWRVNKARFRDREFAQTPPEGKKTIFVVGDSFVAGAGLENVEDRLSNRLARRLSDTHVVYNLGQNGAGSGDFLKILKRMPFRADLVVLSHYVNDIEGIAVRKGLYPFGSIHGSWLWELVSRSSLLNYLFQFHFYELGAQKKETDFLERMYRLPEVLDEHFSNLADFVSYQVQNDSQLVVVSWHELVSARNPAAPVTKYFRTRGIPVVDSSEVLRDYSPEEMSASRWDFHPSALANALMEKALYQKLRGI